MMMFWNTILIETLTTFYIKCIQISRFFTSNHFQKLTNIWLTLYFQRLGRRIRFLPAAISVYYIQFVFFKDKYIIWYKSKNLKFSRNASNKENFNRDIKNTKWDEISEAKKRDIELSLAIFVKVSNNILDWHLPLRKLSIKAKKLSQPLDYNWGTHFC